MKEINQNEIIMICDPKAWRFEMDNCTTKILQPNVGFMELGLMIHPEMESAHDFGYDFSQFKLVILMMGRADLNIPTVAFKMRWYFLMEVIQEFYPQVTCLIAPSLSTPADNDLEKAKADYRSIFLSYYAHDYMKMEFTRPERNFGLVEMPIEHFYDEYGNLTELGVSEIRSNLLQKIQGHSLLEI